MPSRPRKSPVKRTSAKPDTGNYVERSSLYREFLAEREEILRHKWIESEKLGKDIGFERALLSWIRMHRDKWRASRRQPAAERDGSGA